MGSVKASIASGRFGNLQRSRISVSADFLIVQNAKVLPPPATPEISRRIPSRRPKTAPTAPQSCIIVAPEVPEAGQLRVSEGGSQPEGVEGALLCIRVER
jgi:hypothetical protein